MEASDSLLSETTTYQHAAQTDHHIAPDQSFRFLDLPAEIRTMVYDLIIPERSKLPEILLKPNNPWHSWAGAKSRGLSYDRWRIDLQYDDMQWLEDQRRVVSMMKSCRICLLELGIRFYNDLHSIAWGFVVAKLFIHRPPPTFRAALQRFDVLDSREYWEVRAKRERVLIASVFAECSRLQSFSWGDSTAALTLKSRVRNGGRKG